MLNRLFFLVFLSCVFSANAQNFTTTYSEPLSELPNVMRFVPCQNGNTMLVHADIKRGIQVILYDKEHKLIKEQWILTDIFKDLALSTGLSKTFSIKDKVYFFLQKNVNSIPTCLRIIIDGNTGNMVSEDPIATLSDKKGTGKPTMFGMAVYKEFFAVKDEFNDHYAIIAADEAETTVGKRIMITEYDGNDKEIRTANFDTPAEITYNYAIPISMAMRDGNLYILTQSYDTYNQLDKPSDLYMSALPKGSKKMLHSKMVSSGDIRNISAQLLIDDDNKVSTVISFLTRERQKAIISSVHIDYYAMIYFGFDAALNIQYTRQVTGTKANEQLVQLYPKKKRNIGLPQVLQWAGDKTILLATEEYIPEPKYFAKTIGLINLAKDGKELNSYVIPKSQLELFGAAKVFDQSTRNTGVFSYILYTSYNLFSIGSKQYFIFNDNPRNFEVTDPADITDMKSVAESTAFCYSVEDGKMIKSYLFGKTDNEDDLLHIDTKTGYFDSATNTYICLAIQGKRKDRVTKVAWVKFK